MTETLEFDLIDFASRHIGPSEADTQAMLKTVGALSLEDFIARVVPTRIRSKRPLALEPIVEAHG